MALKILVAHPENDFLEAASDYLKKQLYKVDTANNGKTAQSLMYNNEYFAILLGYNLKNHSGPAVLNFCKTNHKKVKAVIIINDPKILEEEETSVELLVKAGATDIVVAPFTMENLSDTLEDHQSLGELVMSVPKNLSPSEEILMEMNEDNFTKLPIKEFFTSKSMIFPVYVKLGSSKFVKILHAGDEFDRSRLDKYIEKKVEYLYIEKKDRRKYILLNNHLSKKAVESKTASTQLKTKLLKNVTEKYLEETFSEGLKPQLIDQGKEICENISTLIETDEKLFDLLRNYQDLDPTCVSHAFLMTVFSTSIIKHFEWQSKLLIQNTALACFFHDIGKSSLKPGLIDKRPEQMTAEELEEYKQHPTVGAEMVSKSPLINSSIRQIISQHHEAYDGSGFPAGLKGSSIVTIGNILCLCDDFTNMIVQTGLKPIECLKEILTSADRLKKYDSLIVENFIKVFADPAKIKKQYSIPTNSRLVKSAK